MEIVLEMATEYMEATEIHTTQTLLKVFGIPLFIIVGVFFLLKYAENIMIWKGAILQLFSGISTTASKAALSSKLKGSVSKSVREVVHNQEILPDNLKVEWVKEDTPESFVKEEQVIVRIKKSKNPHENLVTTTAAFVNAGLLYNHRRYLDEDVMKASRFNMIRTIVSKAGKNDLTYFEENYLPNFLIADEEAYDYYQKLRQIDKNGMFVNILLNEYLKAADSLFGDEIDPCLVAESRELVTFLYNIATRDSEDNTDLLFCRNYFKIAIVLSYKMETVSHGGLNRYYNRILKDINEGYSTVYMLAVGRKTSMVNIIADKINNDETLVLFADCKTYKHVFKDGRKMDAVICEISSKM